MHNKKLWVYALGFGILPMTLFAWSVWYNTAFIGNSKSSGAMAGLYGKSDVCKDKESFPNNYALLCQNIYKFCSAPEPNIYTHYGGETDFTDSCNTYMNTTKPFRLTFLPSIVVSVVTFALTLIVLILDNRKRLLLLLKNEKQNL